MHNIKQNVKYGSSSWVVHISYILPEKVPNTVYFLSPEEDLQKKVIMWLCRGHETVESP